MSPEILPLKPGPSPTTNPPDQRRLQSLRPLLPQLLLRHWRLRPRRPSDPLPALKNRFCHLGKSRLRQPATPQLPRSLRRRLLPSRHPFLLSAPLRQRQPRIVPRLRPELRRAYLLRTAPPMRVPLDRRHPLSRSHLLRHPHARDWATRSGSSILEIWDVQPVAATTVVPTIAVRPVRMLRRGLSAREEIRDWDSPQIPDLPVPSARR